MHSLVPLFVLTATLLATPASAQVFVETPDACVLCDDGGGFALVPDDPGDDWCAQTGWYGDGLCDADCPQPDPDCEAALPQQDDAAPSDGDWCADMGWYGDGLCDADCPQPDPDCA